MTIRFDHLGILSSSPEQNVEIATFFSDVLGFAVEGDPAGGYAEVRLGDTLIALHVGSRQEGGPTAHGGTLLQMTSDDVDSDLTTISERGGTISVPAEDMPWGRSAYVQGPQGVLVELYQP